MEGRTLLETSVVIKSKSVAVPLPLALSHKHGVVNLCVTVLEEDPGGCIAWLLLLVYIGRAPKEMRILTNPRNRRMDKLGFFVYDILTRDTTCLPCICMPLANACLSCAI